MEIEFVYCALEDFADLVDYGVLGESLEELF